MREQLYGRAVLLLAVTITAFCCSVAASQAAVRMTSVQPGTRTVLADGLPFVAKGYNYIPIPVTDQWPAVSWAADPDACRKDAALLKASGVTLVRIWADAAPDVGATLPCLDELADADIGVAWTISVLSKPQSDAAWLEAYWEVIERHVVAFRNHEATLFWMIGNEVELIAPTETAYKRTWFGSKATGQRGVLDEIARRVRAADPNHLVGSSGSTAGCLDYVADANVPALDLWGINAYPGQRFSTGCNGQFWSRMDQVDPRPKLITEFGTDRFKCIPGLLQQDNSVQSCRTFWPNRDASSREDQVSQRDWLASLWDDAAPHIASAGNPNGEIIGGTAFMYSDNWGKCELCPTSSVHDVVGLRGPVPSDDGLHNLEFLGATHAQPRGLAEPRVTTLAFDALAARWAAVPPPSITVGPGWISYPPCTSARVDWTTSEPASSEIQLAPMAEVTNDAGDMVADNTIFRRVAYDPTPKLQHNVTIQLTPGSERGPGSYKLVARSFTTDGRSVTSEPLVIHC